MALIKCHDCGKDISDEAKFCPGCGAKPKRDMKPFYYVMMIIFGIFIAHGIYVANDPVLQEKGRKRDAIELCWSTVQTPGLAPSAVQLAAATCRMMESEFIEKYGVRP